MLQAGIRSPVSGSKEHNNMALFNRIPERFFSILVSQKKELYVQALFVLRQAFKTELVIRREDLVVMLMDALEEIGRAHV